MSAGAIVTAVAGAAGSVLQRMLPDKQKADEITLEIVKALGGSHSHYIKEAASVIRAEAQSQSWMTRNWRPITMLFLVGLVGAHWLGMTAPNLSEAQVLELLAIVKLGLGGYVLGRSGEQIAKAAAKAYEKRHRL